MLLHARQQGCILHHIYLWRKCLYIFLWDMRIITFFGNRFEIPRDINRYEPGTITCHVPTVTIITRCFQHGHVWSLSGHDGRWAMLITPKAPSPVPMPIVRSIVSGHLITSYLNFPYVDNIWFLWYPSIFLFKIWTMTSTHTAHGITFFLHVGVFHPLFLSILHPFFF